eukprot:scaffold124604_cov37-Prasinocladus_malaysianus.AAC.2
MAWTTSRYLPCTWAAFSYMHVRSQYLNSMVCSIFGSMWEVRSLYCCVSGFQSTPISLMASSYGGRVYQFGVGSTIVGALPGQGSGGRRSAPHSVRPLSRPGCSTIQQIRLAANLSLLGMLIGPPESVYCLNWPASVFLGRGVKE